MSRKQRGLSTSIGDGCRLIDSLQQSIEQHDVSIGLDECCVGKGYLEANALTEALSELDLCMKRRGEVLALFLDESPTYGYFPILHYYLGRVRAVKARILGILPCLSEYPWSGG